MKNKKAWFRLFRYQLLPINPTVSVDDAEYNLRRDKLIAAKNKAFAEVLGSVTSMDHGDTAVRLQWKLKTPDFLLGRIAVKRQVNLETESFGSAVHDHWPTIWIAFWNEDDQQQVAIQHRSTAFQLSTAPINLLERTLRERMRANNLTVTFEPQFNQEEFWNLALKHKEKIRELTFELVTPNLPNISSTLSEDLAALAKSVGSSSNEVTLKAPADAPLRVEADNPQIADLVAYASKGGGSIELRLLNVKKRITTSSTVREVSIDEARLTGTGAAVADALKELMKADEDR